MSAALSLYPEAYQGYPELYDDDDHHLYSTVGDYETVYAKEYYQVILLPNINPQAGGEGWCCTIQQGAGGRGGKDLHHLWPHPTQSPHLPPWLGCCHFLGHHYGQFLLLNIMS